MSCLVLCILIFIFLSYLYQVLIFYVEMDIFQKYLWSKGKLNQLNPWPVYLRPCFEYDQYFEAFLQLWYRAIVSQEFLTSVTINNKVNDKDSFTYGKTILVRRLGLCLSFLSTSVFVLAESTSVVVVFLLTRCLWFYVAFTWSVSVCIPARQTEVSFGGPLRKNWIRLFNTLFLEPRSQ